MLINVAGEGGDCDLEVGLDDPGRYIAAPAGLNKTKKRMIKYTGQDHQSQISCLPLRIIIKFF